ncbi:hypothetical protein QFC21_002445 [Naganishia friedmannii]|uniref:Uncharacterized protein n=1 Tax=Naganishia friedmannii TaxID=89922 RepID=A0ACC2W005_9TREE|nr:hypothetical protein QFC21_002445 [Naganishia friedmannii]
MARDVQKILVDNPQKTDRKKASKKGKEILSSLNANGSEIDFDSLELNEYEQIIAGEIIPPSSISTTFESIGGLDDVINTLRESVIYPLTFPELFRNQSGLLGAPKGVLLYGHPGCGKTMVAKALAKESGATFINLPLSSLTRSGNDHEVTGMMKAEFMTLWDGLTSGDETRVIVLGATNRPNDIDPAILRRMPKRFAIRLPNLEQRKKILEIMLATTPLEPGFSLDTLARKTDGLSGSDLRETCRNAAMKPVRELMREKGAMGIQGMEQAKKEGFKLRPLQMSDFIVVDSHAYSHVEPSGSAQGMPGRYMPRSGGSDPLNEPVD